MKIDLKKWNTVRLDVEAKIREAKENIRSTSLPDWKWYTGLESLKGHAHRLYQVRAHLKGKLHAQKSVWYEGSIRQEEPETLERQASAIKDLIKDFELPELVQATA
jgi:hypothetical protein